MTTHFNAVVLTFCAWKWWTGIKSSSCWAELPLPTLLLCSDHCQLSETISLSETAYCCALCCNTLFQSLHVLLSSSKWLHFTMSENKLSHFYAFWVPLYFYYWCFTSCWNQTGTLHWKWIPVFITVFLLVLITNTKTLLFHKQHNWMTLKLTELHIFNETEEATKCHIIWPSILQGTTVVYIIHGHKKLTYLYY